MPGRIDGNQWIFATVYGNAMIPEYQVSRADAAGAAPLDRHRPQRLVAAQSANPTLRPAPREAAALEQQINAAPY